MRDNYSVLESAQLFIQNYEMYENQKEKSEEIYKRLLGDDRIDIIKRQSIANQLRKIYKMYK